MDLSIVISLYNENESLRELTEWIDRAIASSSIAGIDYEILMIDDGSDDGSWQTIKDLSKTDSHIRAYSFRRNYGPLPSRPASAQPPAMWSSPWTQTCRTARTRYRNSTG